MGQDYGVPGGGVGGAEEGVIVVDGARAGVEERRSRAEAAGDGADAHGDGVGGGLTSGVGCWSIWV